MRRLLEVIAAMLLLTAGCTAPDRYGPGLPGDINRNDQGTATGVWRNDRGLVVTIDLNIGTFAAQNGCTLSGGALIPLGHDRFRIDRYRDDSHSTDKCGPWKNGPAILPFDGGELTMTRTGNRLVATGDDKSTTLDRVGR